MTLALSTPCPSEDFWSLPPLSSLACLLATPGIKLMPLRVTLHHLRPTIRLLTLVAPAQTNNNN